MSMCLFYNPPETAVEPLNYFFSRLDEFMALKPRFFAVKNYIKPKFPAAPQADYM